MSAWKFGKAPSWPRVERLNGWSITFPMKWELWWCGYTWVYPFSDTVRYLSRRSNPEVEIDGRCDIIGPRKIIWLMGWHPPTHRWWTPAEWDVKRFRITQILAGPRLSYEVGHCSILFGELFGEVVFERFLDSEGCSLTFIFVNGRIGQLWRYIHSFIFIHHSFIFLHLIAFIVFKANCLGNCKFSSRVSPSKVWSNSESRRRGGGWTEPLGCHLGRDRFLRVRGGFTHVYHLQIPWIFRMIHGYANIIHVNV